MITFWLDQASRYPLLPKDEVLRLAKIIQNPESSKASRERSIQKLVRHNLKLIPGITAKVTKPMRLFDHSDDNLVDLYQVGVIGLRKAAEKFDHTRGYAFSTYAVPWVRQIIFRESYKMMTPIRVPEGAISSYYSYKYGKDKEGYPLLSEKKKERLNDVFMAMSCTSLDTFLVLGGDELVTGHDVIASKDYNTSKPLYSFDHIIAKTELTDFEKKILRMKYMDNTTAAQIARETGRSSTMIRDNIKRSINKIASTFVI